jgi:hypothetical protein
MPESRSEVEMSQSKAANLLISGVDEVHSHVHATTAATYDDIRCAFICMCATSEKNHHHTPLQRYSDYSGHVNSSSLDQ